MLILALSLALAAPLDHEDDVEPVVSEESAAVDHVIASLPHGSERDLPEANFSVEAFVPARFDGPVAPIPASVRKRNDTAIVVVAGAFVAAMTTGVFMAARLGGRPNHLNASPCYPYQCSEAL